MWPPTSGTTFTSWTRATDAFALWPVLLPSSSMALRWPILFMPCCDYDRLSGLNYTKPVQGYVYPIAGGAVGVQCAAAIRMQAATVVRSTRHG